MATQTTLTLNQFLALPEREADGTHYELSEGELIKLSPVGYRHSLIVANITILFGEVLDRKNFVVAGGEAGFVLNPNPETATVRAADVAVSRREQSGAEPPIGLFRGAPLLAVEVISPSNTAEDMARKTDQYLAAGSQEVWVVYPETRNVYVYTADRRDPHVVEQGESIDCILGHRFEVSKFFEY
jgi:Uma2 family endonuclease